MLSIENKELYNQSIDKAAGIAVDLAYCLNSGHININYLRLLIIDFQKCDIDLDISESSEEFQVYQKNKIKFLRISNEELKEIINNKVIFSQSILDLDRMKF